MHRIIFADIENKAKILGMVWLLFLCFLSHANPDVGVDSHFLLGVQKYQTGQYTEAEESFRSDYENGHETAELLHNWGLTSYRLGRKGMGVALWRRALYLSPEFNPAYAALEFAANEMSAEVFGTRAFGWEWFRTRILGRFDLQKASVVTYLLLLFCGFLWIRFLGARKRTMKNESIPPPFPTIAAGLTVVFLASLFLTGAKYISLRETRATIITPSAPLRSGPNAEDNTLIDLIEGLEVIVRNVTTGWIQVQYPGGPAGWVPQETLFQHTGEKKLW